MSEEVAANKAAAARRLAAAPAFVIAELRRADPDAAEAERVRAVAMFGGRAVERQENDDAVRAS